MREKLRKIRWQDLSGKRFGRLTAQWPVGKSKASDVCWLCSCDCGKLVVVACRHLVSGGTKSCKCYDNEKRVERNKAKTRHGKSRSLEGRLFYSARCRAYKNNLPCTITIDDVVIPEKCALLGIPLRKTIDGGHHRNSPSIDRIIPEKGYVKGNIQIISVKANAMKQDATLEELETLVRNWRNQTCAY